MSDTLKIILGIIASGGIFYITSSMALAQKQLLAATRLAGYIAYWQNWILEHEMFGVYHEGMKWNEEIREILKRGGRAEDVVNLGEEKKKHFLEDIKQKIETGDVKLEREKLIKELQRLPKEAVSQLIDYAKMARQNIVDGKTFISDEEATTVGVWFTKQSIELKMGIIDLVDSGTTLLLGMLNNPAQFESQKVLNEISQLIWKGIVVSKNIDLLASSARSISSKSVLSLTSQNIRNGSRITRR